MARMRKIPDDTKWFHYHNENPKGQRAADCSVRAIARATGKTWDSVYDDLFNIGKAMRRMPNEKEVIAKYLENLGWVKHKQPKKGDNTKLTGREFVEARNIRLAHVPVIMNIGGHHMTCFVDGKINDIWDCTGDKVGNFWTRQ